MSSVLVMLCPNHEGRIVSRSIGICSECIEKGVKSIAQYTHESLRLQHKLVPTVPKSGAITCDECGNHCRIDEGERGFCNLRIGRDSRVIERFPGQAIVSWYYDPLPTNCVADWVCSLTKERKLGVVQKRLKNLAVFYGSCNSDCLYCQNGSYRNMMSQGKPLMTPQELADAADDYTACVCFFGGDPAPNSEHSLETSRLLNEERHVRVCYETNGNISQKWLKDIARIVIDTGGTFKFDIKAVSPNLYRVLTGVSNSVMLRNFKEISSMNRVCDEEFLVASVLLVPGYIGTAEIRRICEFIAENDPTIPTSFLGFYPHHAMSDLPRTSRAHALSAIETAKELGLTNVRIGNRGLLGSDEYRFD